MSERLIPDTNLFKHLQGQHFNPLFSFLKIIYRNSETDHEIFSEQVPFSTLTSFRRPYFDTKFCLETNNIEIAEIFVIFRIIPHVQMQSPLTYTLARSNKSCVCSVACTHFFIGHPRPLLDIPHKYPIDYNFWFDA